MLKRLLSLEPCNMHMALNKEKTCTWTANRQQYLTQRYDPIENRHLVSVTYLQIILTGNSSKESCNILVQRDKGL